MHIEECKKLTGKGIKIAIIDSGINYKHKAVDINGVTGFSLYYDNTSQQVCSDCNFNDEIGHGTAVYKIIEELVPEADITIIKIFNKDLTIKQENFEKILQYISLNYKFDIINLSLGVATCDKKDNLYNICDQLYQQGTLLISAFDNAGGVSFPAAFDNVIGVDSSINCTKVFDFEHVDDSIVNIRGRGIMQRIHWAEPQYIMASGNSFTCGYITAFAAKFIQYGISGFHNILTAFREISKKQYLNERKSQIKNLPNDYFKISKAVIFPFNKEMHALIRYSELLSFDIMDIYDLRLSGHVGANVSNLLQEANITHDYKIKNVNEIEWESCDTIIIGHTDELLNLIGEDNFKENLILKALEHNVNIYSFDDLDKYENVINKNLSQSKIYWPQIDSILAPINRFSKLYSTTRPVLGIFGTQSRQGKYTLQLLLRKKFLEAGYAVGQIGTEPNSLLFGMDFMYHSGYKSNIKGSLEETVHILNNMIWNISDKDTDIIIVGSQSGIIPYNTYNVQNYPMAQQIFLQAVRPDAVLLCINPYDEVEFIKRSINAIEGLSSCKVISLVCFPMNFKSNWSGFIGSKVRISKEEEQSLKENIMKELGIPLYILGDEKDMNSVFDGCIEFFCE